MNKASRIEDYRRKAEAAREAAGKAQTQNLKDEFLKAAQAWDDLAQSTARAKDF